MPVRKKVLIPIFFQFILVVTAEIQWYLQSTTFVFNENITLFCNTTNSERLCNECTERWYGGNNLDILTFNGFSNRKDKYETTKSKDGFGLVIKNLSTNDINVPYKCSFGFDSYKEVLKLPDWFEIQPNNDTLSTNYSVGDSKLSLNIELKLVYPIPNCTILLNKTDVSTHLVQKVEKQELFYRVLMQVDYNTTSNDCMAEWQLQCRIGTQSKRWILTNITSSCHEERHSDQTNATVSPAVISLLVLTVPCIAVFIYFMIWKCYLIRRNPNSKLFCFAYSFMPTKKDNVIRHFRSEDRIQLV